MAKEVVKEKDSPAEPQPQLDPAALAAENEKLKAQLAALQNPQQLAGTTTKGPLKTYRVTGVGRRGVAEVQPADVQAIDESEAIRLVVKAQKLQAYAYTFRAERLSA